MHTGTWFNLVFFCSLAILCMEFAIIFKLNIRSPTKKMVINLMANEKKKTIRKPSIDSL